MSGLVCSSNFRGEKLKDKSILLGSPTFLGSITNLRATKFWDTKFVSGNFRGGDETEQIACSM